MGNRIKGHLAIFSLTLLVIVLTILSQAFTNGPVDRNNQESDEPTLRALADKAGLLLGVTVSSRDDARKAIFLREFNTGTRTCYPRSINKSPGEHDLEGFNTGVNWLYELKMKPLHHMLFGPSNYEQEWVRQLTSATVLDSLMKDRIDAIMVSNDNASKVYSWNVVNEALDNTGAYRPEDKMVWAKMGYEDDKSGLTGEDKVNSRHPVFIRKSFEYSGKYAKGKLELREYNIEAPGIKAKAFYQLVRHLQNSGVRIDAVGFQCHFDIEGEGRVLDPQGLATEIRKYQKLGLEVYLDEVDFGRKKIPWTPELAQKQKQEFKKLMTVALTEGVTQVHFWGLVDGDDKGFRTDENPLLFDRDLNPKPAYFGVKEALTEYLQKTGKMKK